MGLIQATILSPPVMFLLTVQGTSFVDLFCYLCFMFVCHTVLSVPCNFVVTCLERTDLLTRLFVMFSCVLSLSHMVSWVRCGT